MSIGAADRITISKTGVKPTANSIVRHEAQRAAPIVATFVIPGEGMALAVEGSVSATRSGVGLMSSRIVKLVPVAALSLVMVPGLANAQAGSTRAPSGDSAATAKPGDSAKLAPADRRFVEQAARGGAAEVAMGKLAQQKASSDQVKQFGEHMVQDHSKANEQLKQLVQDKGVSLPQEPSKAQQEEMAKLGKMSGAEFDRQYMAQMVSDHRKTVAEFKRAAESAQDSEIKAFASKTLPTLQEHLSQAQTIRDSVKSASR